MSNGNAIKSLEDFRLENTAFRCPAAAQENQNLTTDDTDWTDYTETPVIAAFQTTPAYALGRVQFLWLRWHKRGGYGPGFQKLHPEQ